jgi:acyl-CoA synthetase (NDP forming)
MRQSEMRAAEADGAAQAAASEGASATERLRRALFFPRSVAVIGQSNDAGKTAGRPLKYLRQAGFAGNVYPVNARRDEVLGERAWPSVEALPEVPEHAYVVAPVEAAMEAIEACGRLGVTVATVLTDGFGEAGEAGRAREARLREIVAATGMRIVGPSSLGIVNLRNGALITANAAYDETDLPKGRIFAASHSGGMIGTLLSRGKACGIGFAGLVSVGGEVDLSLGDICDVMLGDPDIDGYVLFLETLRHAERLRAFAQRAAAAGKPVLAYKLGRSLQGRELAVTHTGALAGEDDVADAFLRDCGIARVETLSALIEGLPLLRRIPPRKVKRTPTAAVVTTTAGGAATVVDPLAGRGVDVVAPSKATLARFAAAGIKVAPARLIDLTLAGARYDVMKGAIDILTTAPEYDIVVVVVGSSARFYPHLAVQPIIDSAGSDKPIAVFLVPEAPQARAALGAAGVANFYTPEACADAVAAAQARRAPRALPGPPGTAGVPPALSSLDAGGTPAVPGGPGRARRTRSLRAVRPFRHSPRPVGGARHRYRCAAGAAVRLSGGAEGAIVGDHTQVRCRRRQAGHCRRGVAPSCHRGNAQAASRCRTSGAARPGAADDGRRGRGVGRLPGRSRCRPAGNGRGRRHLHGNLPRPQPAPRSC